MGARGKRRFEGAVVGLYLGNLGVTLGTAAKTNQTSLRYFQKMRSHRTYNPGRTLEAMPPVTSVPLEPPNDPSMDGSVAGDISVTQAPSAPKTPSVSPASNSHLIHVYFFTRPYNMHIHFLLL